MQRNHYQTLKTIPDGHLLVRTGITEASTFKGYCSKHDEVIFKPIESRPLDPDDQEQAFVLFVRAFSYEFAQKRRMLEWQTLILKEVRNIVARELLEHFETLREGLAAFFRQDAPYYMVRVFSALENKNFSDLTTVWKTVNENIGLSACCVFSPLLDGHEEHMRKTWGTPQPLVAFNLVPGKSATHVVASWLPNSNEYCDWINDEVRTKEGLELFINRCAFAESEDTCLRPSLWESLSESEKKTAELAMVPAHNRGPLASMPRIVKL
ncbi:MAG: hypothetical protein OEM83_08375 [Gammaproteobacteria bacterium]|nr:hypothetical protein [Gammaproteobacteria bacterium]